MAVTTSSEQVETVERIIATLNAQAQVLGACCVFHQAILHEEHDITLKSGFLSKVCARALLVLGGPLAAGSQLV